MKPVTLLVSNKFAANLVKLLCTGHLYGYGRESYEAYNLVNYAGPHRRGRRPDPRRAIVVDGVRYGVPRCYSYGGRR